MCCCHLSEDLPWIIKSLRLNSHHVYVGVRNKCSGGFFHSPVSFYLCFKRGYFSHSLYKTECNKFLLLLPFVLVELDFFNQVSRKLLDTSPSKKYTDCALVCYHILFYCHSLNLLFSNDQVPWIYRRWRLELVDCLA